MKITEIQKFVVALVGAAGVAVSLGLLSESVSSWVAVAVAFLSAYGVYRVPNAEAQADGGQSLVGVLLVVALVLVILYLVGIQVDVG